MTCQSKATGEKREYRITKSGNVVFYDQNNSFYRWMTMAEFKRDYRKIK